MELTPGAVIAGRYRVDQKVGAGGMGEVWAGEDLGQHGKVALKTLLTAAACNHEIVARFKREAFILGRIQSDHVARVIDFIADDEHGLVLVMEFVEGDTLTRILTERSLTVEEAIDLGVDIASALVDLHKTHIIHRDLKPGNILFQLLPDGRRRAVVVDFGVSRLNQATDDDGEEITGITRADMAVGTIEYMAPEQVLNSRQVTGVADIYATGAILYRAAAGQHIFGHAADAELARKKLLTDAPPLALARDDELAQAFAAVVMRAVKRRPAERFQTAEELRDALLPLREKARAASAPGAMSAAVESTTDVDAQAAAAAREALAAEEAAAPPTLRDPTPKPRRRKSSVPAGVLVGTVLGVGLGALLAMLVGRTTKPAPAPGEAKPAVTASSAPEVIPASLTLDGGASR